MKEFVTIYQQFFPMGDPSKFSHFVFNVFDTNKVGIFGENRLTVNSPLGYRGPDNWLIISSLQFDWRLHWMQYFKDGYISFREFISALSVTSRGTLDEKLECKFSLMKNCAASSFRGQKYGYVINIIIQGLSVCMTSTMMALSREQRW